MQVREIMTYSVAVATPAESIQDAAKKMAKDDFGALPVAEDDRLIGMVTDRDIVTRAVARGLDPDNTCVRDVMSRGVKYVFDDESCDDAARSMARLQVKRLPVLNREKRLVGIVSLGDMAATRSTCEDAAEALSAISRPNPVIHHHP